MNYFSGGTSNRGYYVYVQPVQFTTVKLDNGTEYKNMSCRIMGDKKTCGFKMLLEGTKRKSEKRMAELWTKVEPLTEKLLNHFIVDEYQLINETVQASK